MKKFSALAVLVLLSLPFIAAAQPASSSSGMNVVPQSQPPAATTGSTDTGYVPIAPIPGLTQGAVANSQGLADFLNNLYKYLVGLAATLAVILIIWGGLEISTQDSISSKSAGRERITQAIIGLVLVLSPVLVFSLINPAILNLSINIGPLHTFWGGYPSAVNNTSGSTLRSNGTGGMTVSGCSAESGNSEFQAVTCSSSAAAQDWSNKNCSGTAVVPSGCQSGQYDSKGNCTSGYQAECLGVSPSSYTLVEIGTTNTGPFYSNQYELRPIDSDANAVSGFVSNCPTHNVCILAGGASSDAYGSCSSSYTFTTSIQNAACVSAKLICTQDNANCASTYRLCAAPGSCPDYK